MDGRVLYFSLPLDLYINCYCDLFFQNVEHPRKTETDDTGIQKPGWDNKPGHQTLFDPYG